jgi:hypothetical protein
MGDPPPRARGQKIAEYTHRLVGYAKTNNTRAGRLMYGLIGTNLDAMRVTAKRHGLLECARGA